MTSPLACGSLRGKAAAPKLLKLQAFSTPVTGKESVGDR